MTYDHRSQPLPAPCIVDYGMIINPDDIRRLLSDLGRVRYIHTIDGEVKSEGEGWIVDVFTDPALSTLIANHLIYINIHSFDYLKLNRTEEETHFDLVQDMRQLRLIPQLNSLQEAKETEQWDANSLEEMVTQVLAAKWDMQIDDDDCPF
ncbi:MAG: hypothetical protein AB4041_09565 [Microcystaceae cyanobacterium]